MAVFHCDTCDATKTVPDKFLGRKVKCPGCKQDIVVQADGKIEDLAATVVVPDLQGAEAQFRCPKCGHTERAGAEAVGASRICRECNATGTVVATTGAAQEVTADDIQVDDLADELAEDIGEDIGEDMDAILPMPARGSTVLLPETLLDEEDVQVGFRSGSLVSNLTAGLFTGLNIFFFCIALAVLIAPGGWQLDQFGIWLDAIAISSIVGLILSSFRSRIYFGIPGLDPATGAVLFILVGAVAAAMQGAEPVSILPTALACTAGMTLATGLLAWFTWAFKSGSWIRFMPVQILGGVVAGLGVTVICAAFLFMNGAPLTLDGLFSGAAVVFSAQSDVSFWSWLPGACFGGLLYIFFRKYRHPAWLALTLVAVGTGCSLLGMAGIELPPALRLECGRLTHVVDLSHFTMVFSRDFLAAIDWDVLLSLRVEMAAGVVLLLTMALYKITRVESEVGHEVRLETELRIMGSSNVIAGLLGGAPISFCLGRSQGHKLGGAGGPLATTLASLVLAGVMLTAGPLFPFIPTFVPAGLLIFFGLNLIEKWLVAARHDFFRSDDYALLVITFAVTVALGFVLGVGTGLALAMMVSVTRYGSGGVIKQIFSGANHRSHVDRAPSQVAYLKKHGDGIFVVRLQGFVTVGSLYGVIRETRRRMQSPERVPIHSLIYDFSSVQRFGSAMSQGFARLHALGLDNEVNLVLTNVPFEIESRLAAAGYVDEAREGGFKVFQNLDYALEWSEDQILEAAGLDNVDEQSLAELLTPDYPVPEHIPYLMKLLQPIKVKSGHHIFDQGDPSDAMYFIQSGMYRIEIALQGGKTIRLKKMGPGAVFGEMGLYTDAPRSASVIASEGGTVYRLSKKRIALIETKLPKLKSSIDRYLVNLLAGRIADANAMVQDLMR